MGLSPSAHNPNKVKIQVQANTNAPDALIAPDLTEADPTQTLTMDLRILLKPIEIIPHQSRMKAIYNFSLFSSPVLPSRIKIKNLEDFKINYSQIAISRFGLGRVICFGHISTLTSCIPSIRKNALFMEKMLRWIGGPRPITRMLCLYNVDPQYHIMLRKNMEGLGFGIDIKDQINVYTENTIILVQTNKAPDPGLIEFVNLGGGLIVVGVDDPKITINDTLAKLGLCYLQYPHEFYDDESLADIVPNKKFEDLQDANLDVHIKALKTMYQQKPDAIDSIQTMATIVGEEIERASIINTNYAYDVCETFGPILHSMIQQGGWKYGDNQISATLTKLIVKAASVLPLSYFATYDFSGRFVGSSMNSDCQQVTVSLSFPDPGWYSTGLWIQPQYLSQVQFDQRVPNCQIIIGCHTFNAIDNEPPWKRFPIVSLRRQITDRFHEIATPYGGMVYFAPGESEIIEKNKSIHVTLSDAVKYPMMILGKPDSWKNTYTEDIPWGEIVTKTIIIAARTDQINMISDQEGQLSYIDSLIAPMVEVSGYTMSKKFRLVFDIEYPHTFMNSYPITIDINLHKKLLHSRELSQEIFEILAAIAYNTIDSTGLDKDLHNSIAYFLSFYSLTQQFGIENVKKAIKCESPGFKQMSEDLAVKPSIFTSALSEARAAQLNFDDDVTDVFITHLNLKSGIEVKLPNEKNNE
ncbi:hypothetical protein TVAG_065490 [Trichomonas vaginalis G3]|uniref:Peptidase M60 domain-containing protein n=1 Tax=Trichomonas vaginalis (strain ATCC PRA-98 / G3) TaxID=412133 RepID=A2GCT2_TRIV3|nr:experimental autoimmune prostatitis antigen 2-related family [Trichomonas vaginalis G3]EAX85034.1 hypothetical protein TVAG_065490 [Trichomonas vaginalis G3]KAI5527809.1 experimental autoimmune prostatitis antigen 2-related family [Trichomonas vaginalis G3]|eukprot:XP_001297964.1 hypothetical protein [Trichomonas vaginalis G3]